MHDTLFQLYKLLFLGCVSVEFCMPYKDRDETLLGSLSRIFPSSETFVFYNNQIIIENPHSARNYSGAKH